MRDRSEMLLRRHPLVLLAVLATDGQVRRPLLLSPFSLLVQLAKAQIG